MKTDDEADGGIELVRYNGNQTESVTVFGTLAVGFMELWEYTDFREMAYRIKGNVVIPGFRILFFILGQGKYDFFRTNEHLGRYVILLGPGGSYLYGTEREDSDIGVRGLALNRKSDLIGLTTFEQYVDDFGRKLIDNTGLFLSKRAIRSFGGYVSLLWNSAEEFCSISDG